MTVETQTKSNPFVDAAAGMLNFPPQWSSCEAHATGAGCEESAIDMLVLVQVPLLVVQPDLW